MHYYKNNSNKTEPSHKDVKEEGVIRDGILKLLRSPGINSKVSIPPAYVAWRAATTTLFLAPEDCYKIPALAGRYDNPIPTRFLAPKDCSKIPAQLWTVQWPL